MAAALLTGDDALANGWVTVNAMKKDDEETLLLLDTSQSSHDEETRVEVEDTAVAALGVRKRRHMNDAELDLLRKEGLKTDNDFRKEKSMDKFSVPVETMEAPLPDDDDGTNDVFLLQAVNAARKAGVAAAGGTLVAVGAILTPLPTPGGILLAGAGLGVLSTEFECAKKALDTGKAKLINLIDSIPDEETDAQVEKESDEADSSKKENKVEYHTAGAVSSSNHAGTLQTSSSFVSEDVRASLEDSARRIGKSIRPFLADEDAPRKALEEVNAISKRTYSKLSEMISFTVKDLEKEQQTATAETVRSGRVPATGPERGGTDVRLPLVVESAAAGDDAPGANEAPGNETSS